MIVTLTKLSICPCGHKVLKDEIPLGTEYNINPDIIIPITFICGGCKRYFSINGVFTFSRNGGKEGFLPEEIFSNFVNKNLN